MKKASVIIPVYNQLFSLLLVLQGFAKQSIETDEFEIIIVNDGSKDITPDTEKLFESIVSNCMVIHTPNNGRAFARNIGINAASTNILIFNDADRIPSSNFVEKHIMHHNEGRKIVVGNPQNFWGKICWESNIQDEILRKKAINSIYYNEINTKINMKPENVKYIWMSLLIGNASINKKIICDAGKFDVQFKEWGFEHFELGFRLWRQGNNIYHDSSIINYHLVHSREKNFYKSRIIENFKIMEEKYDYDFSEEKSFLMAIVQKKYV